ncbi:efflux RND transporter periplasmic adaptor subunit [Halieaceae bacterium IMCC14734]|uniref:Efflux RND transporter periplasmic adaptor subunit n=1 Tax=Candidatus Litorirhabdus singularis TaxID=2518993 RepID=A0ABT3TBH8_9GAMM|nr:efflux RND transporter periplasmic adaptor subunit [Candidatus Litorirhabdus singularis]MCX2979545.1 efflux RND transporter periplasmic adaptor subunit [Candidatus Litorirhabdus singularis]
MRPFRFCLLSLLLWISACGQELPLPQMVEVVVDEAVLEPYQPKTSFVGRLHAREDVMIQARVDGYMTSRAFREGQMVAAGDLLYEIDPAEYEAQMARAKADLAKANAAQAVANLNYNRGRELLPKGAISASEMDKLNAQKLEADASIAGAQAQLKTAEVNLGFTRILAPISGRIGRSVHSPGDLIGPTSGTLTTLVSIDPIQALFQISENVLVMAMSNRLGATKNLHTMDTSDLEVSLELTNRVFYPHVGRIDYFANRISEETGTLEARAIIPNPGGLLVPGQYVRVILEQTNLVEAIFIPQAAVQVDQQGSFALAVDADSMVRRRNVALGERIDEKVVVKEGVDEGEQIIVRGLQQVRPGLRVKSRSLALKNQE